MSAVSSIPPNMTREYSRFASRVRRDEVEASPGIEPGCKDLQSSA
jgi:hypothetical protein